MASKLEDIAEAVDDLVQAGQVLNQLLLGFDPTHAALISGVLGVVQKIAKSYEQ